MPDQLEVDAIIERHRQAVEATIRRQIVNVFYLASAYSEGQLRSELASRHVSMNDFVRHHHELGIQHTRIDNPEYPGWWMWFTPENWNPEEIK